MESECHSGDTSENEVVISGISGRFPESNSMEEFKKQLFDGVDLVTDDSRRWPPGLYDMPTRFGKIKDIQYFDAEFFKIHPKLADTTDPQLRMLLEVSFEAILDAGVNPNDIRGSKTGVFIAVCASDAFDFWNARPENVSGYGLRGCSRSMFANRISYTFDFKGPSYSMDSACSSSLMALQQAVNAIKHGECDSAIVGGVNLILNPLFTLHHQRLGVLSHDGKCKVFDASADGYVRSEAVVAVFLQKSNVAKRIYATVLGAQTNTDGHKSNGITFPSTIMQEKLYMELYDGIGIDPKDVSYIEAHGTGTKVGDPQEVNGIAEVFCKNRTDPLLIGAVKSNMGHSESASGLCSVAKVVIAMEAGMIPHNLHLQTPNKHIPALKEGVLKVVTENEPWNGGIVAVNSFGFGGCNVHVVLHSNMKTKNVVTISPIPRLIGVSGRTEEAVKYFIERIEQTKHDEEFFALLHEIHKINVNGHPYRGYAVLKDEPLREVSQISIEKRPVVFIYSGMGAQWPGMGKQLMQVDCFQASIKKCAEALISKGIDLEDILTDESDTKLDNFVHTFVSITAMHIALTDTLKTVGIEPSIIIGHSLGEIGCAYGDSSLTREQAILAAYYRGRAVLETDLPPGTMAAVGLSLEETERRCPPEIFAACHNSEVNTTISGPPESMEAFLMDLQKEGIIAKKVKTLGRAFHSKYIADAGPYLREALDEAIPNPRPRSPKWISSSIPESDWKTPLAQCSSPAYFVNNLLSPVLFQEALKYVPDNSIVIEIDSNGLLQSILRKSLGIKVTTVSLSKRGYDDNVSFLLAAIGKLFIAGAQPKISNLYPPVSFPVSRGTPMINSMIEWDHSREWFVTDLSKMSNSGEFNVEVDLNEESYQYLTGYNIDDRSLFPASGYLSLVWKTFAEHKNVNFEQMPVVFTDVQFHRDIIMPEKGCIKFSINIFGGTGKFEVCESRTVVASGMITIPEDFDEEPIVLYEHETRVEKFSLTSDDIYKELGLRGYDYKGVFRGINKSDNSGITGMLEWKNNWTGFIDTMLQFHFLGKNTRELYLPTGIQRISINPKEHYDIIKKLTRGKNVPVRMYHNIDIMRSAGVELHGIRAISVSRTLNTEALPVLEKYQFVPYEDTKFNMWDSGKAESQVLTVLIQTVIENIFDECKLNVYEVVTDEPMRIPLAPIIRGIIEKEPMMSAKVTVVTKGAIDAHVLEANTIKHVVQDMNKSQIAENADLIILSHVLEHDDNMILENAASSIKDGGFILLEEMKGILNTRRLKSFEVISKQCTDDKMFLLLRKPIVLSENSSIIQITEKNFSWIETLKKLMVAVGSNSRKIYLYAEGEELNGLIGMVNCLRREPGGSNLRSVFIRDASATKFSISAYESQLKKDLVHNVLMNETWGCFRHIELDQSMNIETLQVEHAFIDIVDRGNPNNLKWIEGPIGYHVKESSCPNLYNTYYATLNYRDILLTTGKVSREVLSGDLRVKNRYLGSEFSGRHYTSGRRVMGIVDSNGLATSVQADTGFLWDVPSEWSLEDAATIPVAYAMSYYALVIRGGLKSGESLLIHAGTGGVGQASIRIALHMGCTIFTTVSSREQREFLKEEFPQLKDKHICNSRNTYFEQIVMSHTDGRGVDCVLNSSEAHQLRSSVKCLTNGGRFLEIGQATDSYDSALGMDTSYKNMTFQRIHFDASFHNDSPEKQHLVHLINEGIENGTVKPLPRTVFKEDQVEQAFNYMASGGHIGKVMIKIRDEDDTKTQNTPGKTVMAIPRTYMSPKKCYIVVGGLGGFGLELANWLIDRGATKIILTSRNGVKTAYPSLCIGRWVERGIKVHICTIDVSVEEGARALLKEAIGMGPIGGIFNLASVSSNAMMVNQSVATFEAVCEPKIDVSKMLDAASRLLAPSLDYFVLFSSISSGRGIPGESNNGLANSAMERIVESRQAIGLPGLAIQWGSIGDVDAFESTGGNAIAAGGTSPQRIVSCFRTLDFSLRQSYPVISSMVLAHKIKIPGTESRVDSRNAVCDILGIKNISTVPLTATLGDLGMDSLMNADIKQTLERNHGIVLRAKEIRDLTFGRIIELDTHQQTNRHKESGVVAPLR